jgi:hypothetical protein
MKLIPLRRIDLAIGKPLPWAIYDKNQNLLMRAGEVIEARQQFESLVKRGLFRLPKSAAASAQGVAMPMPSSSSESVAGNETYDFDDMKLPVGSRLQLQISTDQNTERHIAKYLGHIKGVSLLVATPVVDDKVLFIREGQTFIVRAFTGKTAFGFTASVVRACNAPTPYLHLSYPRQLHGVEIRSTKRFAVNLIATAQALKIADAAKLPCLLINVSPSGALVAAAQPLGEIGDAILVAFRVKLGPIDGYIETKGIIRSITHVDTSDGEQQQNIHHGVQFNELQQQDILLLHSLAYQKLVDGSTEI